MARPELGPLHLSLSLRWKKIAIFGNLGTRKLSNEYPMSLLVPS
jgi:hypothetical protein